MSNDQAASEDLSELQLVELGLIQEVDWICKRTASGLWGTVKHKKSIPWDDDANIAFSRKNTICFLVWKKDINKEKFFLRDYTKDEHYHGAMLNFDRISKKVFPVSWRSFMRGTILF